MYVRLGRMIISSLQLCLDDREPDAAWVSQSVALSAAEK